MKKILIIAIVVILLFISGYIIKLGNSSNDKLEVIETTKVEQKSLQDVIVETGIIKPQVGAQITLGSQATGKLMNMYVKVGDRVKKGQIIAKIDDREIKESIVQLQSTLEREKKRLTKENTTFPQRLEETQQEIASLKAQYEMTDRELKRQSELYEKGFTSRNDLDKAETEYQKAEAQYKKNHTILKRIEEEHESEREIITHEIESIKANIEQEKIRLSYTTIYSPLEGIVSEVTAQEGETLVAGLQVAQLITIIVPEKLEMWIYVDETEIGKVHVGMSAQFTVDTYSDKIFTGIIDRINPQPIIKDNIVYFIAIVEIQRDDALLLRPEMTTYVKIVINEKKDVLTVANSALKFKDGKQVVYKIQENNNIQIVAIKTGIRGENASEVLSGLKKGDVVATKIKSEKE